MAKFRLGVAPYHFVREAVGKPFGCLLVCAEQLKSRDEHDSVDGSHHRVLVDLGEVEGLWTIEPEELVRLDSLSDRFQVQFLARQAETLRPEFHYLV